MVSHAQLVRDLTRDLQRFVQRQLKPISTGVRMAIGRAVLNLIDDTRKCQTVQASVLGDETHDDVEHWQPYGFTSVPAKGAEALYLSVGGIRAHGAVIAAMHRDKRPKGLAELEVAAYDDQGQKVHFKRGKKMEVSGCDELTVINNSGASVTLKVGKVIEVVGTTVKVTADHVTVESDDVKLGSASATQGAARNGDAVSVTIPVGTVVVSVAGGAGVMNPAPIVLDGTIQAGSSKVKAA